VQFTFKSFQIALALPAASQENGNYRGIAAYTAYKHVINSKVGRFAIRFDVTNGAITI
jgi:hypothetical protein